MPKVLDLSNIGQKKEGKILDLRMPNPSNENLTVKQFVEFNLYNFDQVGTQLKNILTFLQGQNNVNEIYKQRLETIETLLDTWAKEVKKIDEKNEKN